MTTAVRYTKLTNTTGALIAKPVIDYGQDWATQVVPKTFANSEVGTGAGQTRDGTNAVKGFLIAQFTGAAIQAVVDLKLIKDTAVANAGAPTFRAFINGTPANLTKLAYRIDNSVAGVSSLYIYDQGDIAGTQIAPGDTVIATVAIGYS